MKNKDIKIDAVKLMRDIRNILSEKYYKDTDFMFEELKKIRTKYKMKSKIKVQTA